MSKNTGRSYLAKKRNRMVKALNSMTLGTVLDWLYRAEFAQLDGEPLSLEQYLIEIKEVMEAEKRMEAIEESIKNLSNEEKDRRQVILGMEKGDGVGQFIC